MVIVIILQTLRLETPIVFRKIGKIAEKAGVLSPTMKRKKKNKIPRIIFPDPFLNFLSHCATDSEYVGG